MAEYPRINDNEDALLKKIAINTADIAAGGGGGGGGGTWGSITGTLSDQTDLQAALDAKLDDTATTADIASSLNKRYVTDAQLVVIGNTSGTNSGDQSIFASIVVSGQTTVTTASPTQALTLIAGTAITITTNNTTKEITINSTAVAAAGGSNTQLQYNNSTALGGVSGVTSNGTSVTATSGNLIATRPKFITSIDDTNGNELFVLTATASAVNELTLANAATGNKPSLTASGGDPNIGIAYTTKGTGNHVFTLGANGGSFQVSAATSANCVVQFIGTATGFMRHDYYANNTATAQFGAVATTNDFITGTVAGDFCLINSLSKAFLFSVDNASTVAFKIVASTGQVSAEKTTGTTSATTGALISKGGLGVAEKIFAGNTITCERAIAANTLDDGIIAQNTTAATTGPNHRYAPMIVMGSKIWSASASRDLKWAISGTGSDSTVATPHAALNFYLSTGGGAYGHALEVGVNGGNGATSLGIGTTVAGALSEIQLYSNGAVGSYLGQEGTAGTRVTGTAVGDYFLRYTASGKKFHFSFDGAGGAAEVKIASDGIHFTTGKAIRDDSGNEFIIFTKTSTAVNEITVANAATGGIPGIKASGETNVSLALLAKGTGSVVVSTDGTATPQFGGYNPIFQTNTDTVNINDFHITHNATAGSGASIQLMRGRGTGASPSVVNSGDSIGFIDFGGRATSSYVNSARIDVVSTEAFGSVWGSAIRFLTTLTGGTSEAERARISGAGNLLVGTTSDTGLTGAGGLKVISTIIAAAATTSIASINIPHGSAPSSPTNGDFWSTTAGFYGRVNGATVGPFSGVAGTKTMLQWNALDNQPPSGTFATFNTRNTIAVLEFDAANAEDAVFVGIIPEGASLGTGISVFLHWMGATATTGSTVWTTAFERSNTDLDSDSFATGVNSSASAANGTSGIITKTQIDHSSSEIDGVTAGDLFRLKVTRKAADGSDDMTGDAQLVAVEIRWR